MVVLVTNKHEEDSIKKEGSRVATILYVDFFRCSMTDNSVVSLGILSNFEIMQTFMHVLLPARVKKIQSTRGPMVL